MKILSEDSAKLVVFSNTYCFDVSDYLEPDLQIYYVEPKGKDVSFNRWRVCLYYKRGFAKTVFFNSQAKYDEFLSLCRHDPNYPGSPAEQYGQWNKEQWNQECAAGK